MGRQSIGFVSGFRGGIAQGESPKTRFQETGDITASDDTQLLIKLGTFNAFSTENGPAVDLVRGRGTTETPAAIQSGDQLGRWGFAGQYGTTIGLVGSAAGTYGRARETHSVLAQGTSVDLLSIPNGSTVPTRGLRVDQDQKLVIGDADDVKLSRVASNQLGLDAGDQLLGGQQIYPGTPAGAQQTSCGITAGSGAPSNSNGNNGDYYLRSDGGALTHLYYKSGGTWAGLL